MAQWSATFQLSSLNGSNGFMIVGTEYRSLGGGGAAGDVNGDGFDDLVFRDPGLKGSWSYVLYGHAGGFAPILRLRDFDGQNGFLVGNFQEGDSNKSVSDAGDLNGDGIADFLVGGSGYPNSKAGAAYVVFGHSGRFDARMDLSKLDGTNGFVIYKKYYDDDVTVSSAGDVNGDGIDDLLVGFQADKKEGSVNTNFVVFGKIGGFESQIDLENINGRDGFNLFSGYNYNIAISSVGDINNDGFDDLIVGNSEYSESYVLFGRSNRYPGEIDVEDLNGRNGFVITTNRYDSELGYHASSAGDVNGDGFDDFIVGERYNGGHYNELSYVVFGRENRFAVNFDLNRLNGENGFKIFNSAEEPFRSTFSSAGDVNGDGFDDIIIGIAEAGSENTGASYVVFGKADGFDEEFDLSELDGNNGFRIVGVNRGDNAGSFVKSAGDINRDGFDDLVVEARGAETSYVIFGRKPDASVDLTGTTADQTLAGGRFADNLDGLGGRDLLYGHGGNDRLFGGTGADFLKGSRGNDLLEGGFGNDTLVGGLGQDVLHGGAGRDTFLFVGALTPTNRDIIDDFSHVVDAIRLARGAFAKLDAGRLEADQFKDLADPGSRLDANDRILYDHSTGVLSYDADGNGRAAARVFAVLENTPDNLDHTDFLVV